MISTSAEDCETTTGVPHASASSAASPKVSCGSGVDRQSRCPGARRAERHTEFARWSTGDPRPLTIASHHGPVRVIPGPGVSSLCPSFSPRSWLVSCRAHRAAARAPGSSLLRGADCRPCLISSDAGLCWLGCAAWLSRVSCRSQAARRDDFRIAELARTTGLAQRCVESALMQYRLGSAQCKFYAPSIMSLRHSGDI